MKVVRVRPAISPDQVDMYVRRIIEELHAGKAVDLTVMLRGKEAHHPELAGMVMRKVMTLVGDIGSVEEEREYVLKNVTYHIKPTEGTAGQSAVV